MTKYCHNRAVLCFWLKKIGKFYVAISISVGSTVRATVLM